MEIPFNKPFIGDKELEYVTQSLRSGNVAADGPFTQRCSRLLEQRFGIRRALMTPSCTAALEMAAMLCNLGPGDEVILPSFTFVSTANAVIRAGARPVFVDIRRDTLNIDESLIEAAVGKRTKAVFVVHYAGVGCEMDTIASVASRHGLLVLEDAAQGVNAFYKGRVLGSLGQLGAYSFHHTKNYICGEGGALCVNAPELVERAEIIREKGTNRSQFSRGEVERYTWVDVGSSYVPAEIVCAFLCAQLERLDQVAERRRQIYEFYRGQLESLEDRGLLTLPRIPDGCQSNYHMFYVVLPSEQDRDAAIAYLREKSIQATFHYVPLHTSPMGRALGYKAGDLPATEGMSARLLRLPFYHEITEEQQTEVVKHLAAFAEKSRRASGD